MISLIVVNYDRERYLEQFGDRSIPSKGGSRGYRTTSKRRKFNLLKTAAALIAALPLSAAISFYPALAQQIVPNNDGTMTIITEDGNTFNIDGGTLSGDGKNLFHSFQEFGLDAGQIANFLSNPNIQNILGRINGGNPSVINGLIRVTGGDSNLFLMNPSGIIFGKNASLNVPGDFTATTATGIGFGDNWFNATGVNDYLNLTGNPNSFNFANSESGVIINAADLKVADESNISLTGGTIVNTGTIETEGGNITVAAVPGTNRIRISQEGQLLSIEVAVPQNSAGEALPIRVTDLPNLLRGLPADVETGLTVAANDDVTVTNSPTVIPNQAGTTIISGTVDASNLQTGGVGGTAHLLGNKVGLIRSNVDVSGDAGGGRVLIGGDYKGQGTVPNANVTFVDRDSTIGADALQNGDGGEVIVWSDRTTRVYGDISARGAVNGNGGFVETSSAGFLDLQTTPDVSATNGTGGTWLIDPHNITITDLDEFDPDIGDENPFIATGDDVNLWVGYIENALTDGADVIVSTGTTGDQDGNISLEADLDYDGTGTNSLTFEAANDIFIGEGGEGEGTIFDSDLDTSDTLNLTLTADADNDNLGRVLVNNPINTGGGKIAIEGRSEEQPGVEIVNDIDSAGGNITITGTSVAEDGVFVFDSQISSGIGDITITGNSDNEAGIETAFSPLISTAGNITLTGNSEGFFGVTNNQAANIFSNSGDINITGTSADTFGVNVSLSTNIISELGAISIAGVSNNNQGIQINSGSLAAGNDITLTANGIELTNVGDITADNVIIQPLSPDFDIAIAPTEDLAATLNISQTELDFISEDSNIIIGRDNSSGTITVVNDLSIDNNLTLRSPESGAIAINGAITVFASDLTLNAGDNLNLNGNLSTDGGNLNIDTATISVDEDVTPQIITDGGNIGITISNGGFIADSINLDSSSNEAGGNIALTVSENINVGNINSAGGFDSDGGSVELNATNGSIVTGSITTTGGNESDLRNGDGGSVVITAAGSITTQSIDTTGGNSDSSQEGIDGELTITGSDIGTGSIDGGNILIDSNGVDDDTEGLFTASATIPDTELSIRGTTVTIEHGGGNTEPRTPFIVGDATTNGTVGDIVSASETIAAEATFSDSFISENVTIEILTTIDNPIVAANDGTGSVVTAQTGNEVVYNITGGTLSGDEDNLFHSFTRFDLPREDQTANFVANETLDNILARVSSEDASNIQGTIQVSGGSPNLFLINPAGIIFGSDAQLNVPASFTATTGNGVRFGDNWFSATGAYDAALLNGTVEAIALTSNNPGTMIDNADLTNENGALSYIGGTVVISGNVESNGFNAIALNEGASIVELTDFTISSTEGVDSLPNDFTGDIATFSDLVSSIDETVTTDSENADDAGLEVQNPLNSNGANLNLVGRSNNAQGVRIDTIVNAAGGNINITGTSSVDDGVFIRGQVVTSDDGAINVTGTSTEDIGILVLGDNISEEIDRTEITAGNGAINLTGTSNGSIGVSTQNTDIDSSDGAIDVTGIGNTGIQTDNTTIVTAVDVDSPETRITLTADTMDLDLVDVTEGNGSSFTSNELVLQPVTPTTNINLEVNDDNAPADALNFANGKIQELSENVNLVTIGSEDSSGTITVTDDFDDGLTVESSLTLRTPEGDGAIVIDDAITTSENLGNETPNPNQDVTLTSANDININRDITTNGGNITITANNGDVTTSNLNAASNIATATGGEITVTASGTITPQDITTTNNNIALDGAVALTEDITVEDNGTTPGNIDFNNTVDGAQSLTVNTSGNTTFTEIGTTTPLTSLTTNEDGTTRLNGDVTTTEEQNFGDTLVPAGDIALTSDTDITLNEVDFDGVAQSDLTVIAENNLNLNGTIADSNSETSDDRLNLDLRANNIAIAERIDTNEGDITLTGDEIAIDGKSTVTGDIVTLQPRTTEREIQISRTANTPDALNISQTELNTIEANSIAIGNETELSGTITVNGSVTVEEPITLSTANTIRVNGAITATDNASVTLNSAQSNLNGNITTEGEAIAINSPVTLENNLELDTTQSNNNDGANITVTGDIEGANQNLTLNAGSAEIEIEGNIGNDAPLESLQANSTIDTSGKELKITTTGELSTQDITTAGGDIELQSTVGEIATRDLNSSGTRRGNITLTSGSDRKITVGSIRADSSTGNNGGEIKINVDNEKPGLFVANRSFPLKNIATSIFTNSSSSEAITIKHGGAGEIPFRVADPNLLDRDNPNGTVGAILGVDSEINEGSFLFTEKRDKIEIRSIDPPRVNEIFEPRQTQPFQSEITATNSTFPAITLEVASIAEAREVLSKIEEQAAQKPALVYVSFASSEIAAGTDNPNEYFTRVENCLTSEYKAALDLTATQTAPTICLAARASDKLEILVVTPDAEPIYVTVDVTREEVEARAEDLYLDVSNQAFGWEEPAELLYEWLIASIETELTKREVDNLLFILPPKLRSLPLAALYDANTDRFLIQKGYNIGLAPAINLMNTTYNPNIQNARVLALGASTFEADQNQEDIKAVEIELPQIANLRGVGEPIINEQFTLENLKNSLQKNNSQIVHLSTHADFSTADINEIYIQLYDERLTLKELDNLDLRVGRSDLELLVLSACRSAFGDLDAELGFSGLAVKSGVKTAIGSLWYVGDITTPGLMLEFYHYLETSPFKAEALRLAQVAMIEGQIEIDIENRQMITSWGDVIELPEDVVTEFSDRNIATIDLYHPYYWSAFTIIGSPW